MNANLAVVVPSAIRADLLARCLTTLTAFRPAPTEIVVVDDASPNRDVARVAARFDQIQVVSLPRRSGYAWAANAGIAATTAPIVQVLNDDAEVTAGWATAALEAFTNPAVGSVAPLVLQLDAAGRAMNPVRIDSAGDDYDPGGFAWKRGRGVPVAAAGGLLTPGPVWGANGTAGFFRRAALEQVGLFPPDFGAYFEDVDLAHRLRLAGWGCEFVPASVVWHRVGASYGRRPNARVLRMQSRNEERVYWRNTPARALLTTLPRHAAVLAAKAARRLSEGSLTPWLVGRANAWLPIARVPKSKG